MAKYKKRPDGRYEAKINLGTRPDGGYIRKAVYGHTIAELEENIRQAKNHSEQGVDLVAQKPTVKVWADKWLEVYKPDLKRSMRDNYASIIQKWLEPIHALRIDNVRQIQLQEILQKASAELAQSSVDKVYNCLKGIFSSARQNGLTITDVSEFLTKPTGGHKTKRDALTNEEKDIIISVCESSPDGLLPMLILFAGLRIGEALALTFGDVKGGYINVNKTVVYEENCNRPSIKDSPKSDAGFRKIPIAPPLEAFITPLFYNDSIVQMDSNYIFSRNGNLYSKTMSRRLWAKLMDEFNAKWTKQQDYNSTHLKKLPTPPRKITSHMLRHTFITMLYDADIDVKTAQKWAGHATVSVLMDIYTHLSEERELGAVEKFKRLFEPDRSDDNSDDTDDNLTTQKAVNSAKR